MISPCYPSAQHFTSPLETSLTAYPTVDSTLRSAGIVELPKHNRRCVNIHNAIVPRSDLSAHT